MEGRLSDGVVAIAVHVCTCALSVCGRHNCVTQLHARLPGHDERAARAPTRDDYDESYLERKAQRRPLLRPRAPTFDIGDVSFAL